MLTEAFRDTPLAQKYVTNRGPSWRASHTQRRANKLDRRAGNRFGRFAARVASSQERQRIELTRGDVPIRSRTADADRRSGREDVEFTAAERSAEYDPEQAGTIEAYWRYGQ